MLKAAGPTRAKARLAAGTLGEPPLREAAPAQARTAAAAAKALLSGRHVGASRRTSISEARTVAKAEAAIATMPEPSIRVLGPWIMFWALRNGRRWVACGTQLQAEVRPLLSGPRSSPCG